MRYFRAGATTENLPPGVLYRVVATYKYDAEDTDELSFEKGEVISVVPYDDPETQASDIVRFYTGDMTLLWFIKNKKKRGYVNRRCYRR